MKKNLFDQQQQRFAIRKYAVGAASVMIASLFFVGAPSVSADKTAVMETEVVTATTEITENSSDLALTSETATYVDNNTEEVRFEDLETAVEDTAQPETTSTEATEEAVTTPTTEEKTELETEQPASTDKTVEESEKAEEVEAAETVQEKTTGTLTIQNPTEKGFEVLVTNLIDAKGITAVKIPVWTSNQNQDDLKWYNAQKQKNGSYSVIVETKNHKNELGEYNVHLYYEEKDGSLVGITGQTTTLKKATPPNEATLPIDIPTQGIYVFDKEVQVKNEAKMAAKTEFAFQKGEKVRYDQVLSADNHQRISYVSYSGTRRFIPIAELKTAAPVTKTTGTLSIQEEENGDFNVIVSNVSDSNGIKEVKVPVWSSQQNQDDLKWYQGVRQTDGTYKVAVKLAYHKGDRGQYNIHLYYEENSGNTVGVAATTHTVVKEDSKSQVATPTGELSIANVSDKAFDIIVTNITSESNIKEVTVPVWSEVNGQDDLKWYIATKQTDNSYKVTVSLSDHKNAFGVYHAHLYYSLENGQQVGVVAQKIDVKKVETKKDVSAKATGQLAFNHKENGDFDIIATNIVSPNGVKEVKIPVWSENGKQDDLKWYSASKQVDGSYKVSVKISDHKGDRGQYHAHLYLVENTGKTVGVAASKTTVAQAVTDTRTLAAQGQYTFQKEVDVCNKASLAAKVEFTFTKGESIRYDQLLTVEGKTWISYKSYSGIRRYIAIN